MRFTLLFALLFATGVSASEFLSDIEYGRANGETLLLDVSIPDGQGPFPIAVLIHGGGWSSGDKSGAEKPNSGADITPWFKPLSDAGFAWFSINYRLAPQNRWPACRDDTLTALAWIQRNAAAYGCDPERVAVIGHSAGGHLALLTAFASADIRPDAIVGCAAVSSFEQDLAARGGLSPSLQGLFERPKELSAESLALLRSTSPINLLETAMPPLLLIHGDADRTVPIEQSRDLQRRVQVLGATADLIELPGAQHRLTEWDAADPDWAEKMTDWLLATLDQAPLGDDIFYSAGATGIELLPQPDNLPTPSGNIDNAFTGHGCNLTLRWADRHLVQAEIVSTQGKPIRLRYAEAGEIELTGPVGARWILDRNLNIAEQDRAFHAYVAADGTGQYDTVEKAVASSPSIPIGGDWIIQIAPGAYRELLYIQRERRGITLRGYPGEDTRLSFDLHAGLPGPDGKPIGTFRTASTAIDADDVTAENITFENTAGPVGQALAIRLDGDRNVFRNCRFLGWQDTLLANKGRHYFENCYIEGHVDFIFGGATCYFERCHIQCLRSGYIAAASTPSEVEHGYVFAHCRISANDPGTRVYLGRPWRNYAAVAFHATSMATCVRPEGWHNWGKTEREATARYRESASYGPGAEPSERAKWAETTGPTLDAPPSPAEIFGDDRFWVD